MNVYSFLINLNDKKHFIDSNESYLIKNNNQYIDYCFEINGVKIAFYKSNKVVVQGKNATNIMSKYFNKYLERQNEIMDIAKPTKPINFNKYEYFVGSDEVGVGDYFGGLVVCAVSLSQQDEIKAQSLGINDSKKLTDEKILQLAPKLMEFINYKIAEINPEQYNLLIDKYQNSHVLKTLLHNRALLSVVDNNREKSLVILDQFAESNNYYNYLNKLKETNWIKINIFETKAESKYTCVACASVIARYFFLKQIQNLSKKVDIQLPLGAWNKQIESKAIQLKSKVGFDNLNQFVKLHFKNTEKIK